MSGFSAEWLALREPADHRARDRDLLAAVAGIVGGRDSVSVVDLGCGSGSNLRACAPFLPRRQHWRLVDHDPALLAAAKDELSRWAGASETVADGLRLAHGSRELTVEFVHADLAAAAESAFSATPDLITAAALFDLVSDGWITRLAASVAERNAVFYTALIYNGAQSWEPAHPADRAMLAAFHAHQRQDKGFGPAAGPQASERLAAAFRAHGYEVRIADSPWRLGAGDAPLLRALAEGVAAAARETGQGAGVVERWLAARRGAASCIVGHTDLLATPPRG